MQTGLGVISVPSPYSVPDTLDRLTAILAEKGIKVFARVDHSGEAEKAGLRMPPTQLLIFGNPKGGTPIMLAAPTSAIDLPLKALAWEDSAGQRWLSYNDPDYFRHRFGLSEQVIQAITGIAGLIHQSVQPAQ